MTPETNNLDGELFDLICGIKRVLQNEENPEHCTPFDAAADVYGRDLAIIAFRKAYAANPNPDILEGRTIDPQTRAALKQITEQCAVEIALRTWSEKTQQEIALQVGCVQSYVQRIKEANITSDIISLPETRTDSIGRTRPTTYTRKENETHVYAIMQDSIYRNGARLDLTGPEAREDLQHERRTQTN